MTSPRRAPARKPTAKPSAKSPTARLEIVKPTPVDAQDAAVGRKLREFIEWFLQWVLWLAAGGLAVFVYQAYPQGGALGALAITGVAGLLLLLLLARGSR